MTTRLKRTQRDYPLAFKLSVVDEVEKGEMTYKQAQDQYGIQGRSTVLVWLRKHGRLDWSQGTPVQLSRRLPVSDTPSSPTPQQRIKMLEKQLEEMKLKADFFEAIVKVMEQDYGAPMPKKLHRKSSKRKR